MLRVQALLLAALLALPTAATASPDQAWLFREVLSGGEKRPAAVFLAWDFSRVLFRGTCDQETGELVLDYFGDGAVGLKPGDQLSLGPGDGPLNTHLKTRLRRNYQSSGTLEGRLSVTPRLLRVLAQPHGIDIEAPNEAGEAWHVGRAEPLRRVVEICLRAPHSRR